MRQPILKTRALLTCSIMLGGLLFTSCKNDKIEDEIEKSVKVNGKYSLAIRSSDDPNVDTDYIVGVDDLMNGEISIVGEGAEQPEYHFYQQTGKYLTSVTYTDANIATVYKMENEVMREHGKFSIGRLHLFSPINDTQLFAANVPFSVNGAEGIFYIIDAEDADIVSQKSVDMYPAGNGEQAVFTGAVVRGDQLFVSFFGIASTAWDTQHTDSAYVAVYSYPDFEFDTLLTDDRTGPIGSYASQGYIFKDENNDIYTVSSCALGTGSYQETQHSGILRIKSGETEFDDSFFIDVEDKTGGYKLCNSYYIGDGKVLASIFSFKPQTQDDKWSRRDVKLAIIDLATGDLDYVSGVPVHYGGPTGMMNNHLIIEGEKLYTKIKNDDGIFIYLIDPASKTAIKGAEIVGEDVYGFFDLSTYNQ